MGFSIALCKIKKKLFLYSFTRSFLALRVVRWDDVTVKLCSFTQCTLMPVLQLTVMIEYQTSPVFGCLIVIQNFNGPPLFCLLNYRIKCHEYKWLFFKMAASLKTTEYWTGIQIWNLHTETFNLLMFNVFGCPVFRSLL